MHISAVKYLLKWIPMFSELHKFVCIIQVGILTHLHTRAILPYHMACNMGSNLFMYEGSLTCPISLKFTFRYGLIRSCAATRFLRHMHSQAQTVSHT